MKPAPLSAIWETVTFAFPVLVTVTVCVDVEPVFTLPKERLVLLNESVCVAATPVPLSRMTDVAGVALLTTFTLPLADPAAVGANCTLKLADCPALSERGKDSALVVKPLPVTLTCVIVRVPVPLFDN